MKTRFSKSYQFTGYDGDVESHFRLADLRKAVKSINRLSKDKKFRVEVRGRLGKYNPAYQEYKTKTGYIRLIDATRWDVYLYERS